MSKSDTTPEQARAYIEIFRKHTIPGTDYVDTQKHRILLDSMTDEDAVFVAQEFMRMEAEAAAGRVKNDA